eukprot:jgi/Phyca11/537802/estExt2_fgenesh1_pg.C_PHYCAscaffold_1690003
MKVIPSVVALSAFVAALIFSPETARADAVEAEPGTELFDQFRPVYHFQAREKWMNDPCAPYYDEATGLYHMFYQLNPNSTIWGNMTWGHAVSKDQVTWEDYPNALRPFEDKWDNLGVFSGFAMDKAIDGKHTVFYTGVTALPISWKKEYLFGEHVVYATTDDGGKSWQKGDKPLIELPPKGLNVTGWRDPMPFHSNIYTDKDGKNVLIGWITEDNNFTTGQPQGWDGMLSVPREVGITILRDISDVDEHLVGKGDWIVSDSKDVSCADGSTKQSKTIKTLGVKPLSDLQLLRDENSLEQVASVSVNGTSQVLNSTGASFELIAEVTEFERGSKVGFEVRRSSAGDEVTTVVYDDAEKKVVIDRSKSSTADCAVFKDNGVKPISESVWGHFYLYDLFTGASKSDVCEATREKLSFHVFVDVSSVEVFVNGRFALSARIYPCASQSKSDGIALTASGDATFENVQVWTNPKHAWAETRTVPTF